MERLQKGSLEEKEIALYVFGEICVDIKYVSQIHQKTLQALLAYIIPLMEKHGNLSNKGDMILNSRVCEIIKSY